MRVHAISSKELWAAQAALAVAIILQLVVWDINRELTYGPHDLIVFTEIALAVIIGLTARKRRVRAHPIFRVLSSGLLALISLANITSFFFSGTIAYRQ